MKIATLNVHFMKNVTHMHRLADLIKERRIHIFCMQEVGKMCADTIAKLTGMTYSHINELAILSKSEITSKSAVRLGSGRQALVVKTADMFVATTHLDHQYEEIRLEQLAALKKYLGDIDILCGDFNALRKEDLDEKGIKEVNVVRRRTGWEFARFEAVKFIQEQGFKTSEWVGNTSRFDTRIDFIFRKGDNFVREEVIDIQRMGLSDHNLVLDTFTT